MRPIGLSNREVQPRRGNAVRHRAVRIALFVCAVFGVAVPELSAAVDGETARLSVRGALVHDRRTDLTWQRCTLGQRWSDAEGRCEGEPMRLTFDDAKRLERDGWRIPTLDELLSLVVTGQTPTIDASAFPDTPPLYYWATDNRDLGSAWYVLFENGRSNHYFPPRTNRDFVRFVRTGPWKRDGGPAAPAPAVPKPRKP
jgi:hypothetical protein